MLRRASLAASAGMFVSELALFSGLFYAAHILRAGPVAEAFPSLRTVLPIGRQFPGIVTMVVISMACFYRAGFYDPRARTATPGSLVGRLAAGFSVAFVLSSAVAFFLFREKLSRIAIALGFAMSSVAFLLERLLVRASLNCARRHGRNLRHVVIVGAGEQASRVAELVRKHDEWGFRIEGYLDDGEPRGEVGSTTLSPPRGEVGSTTLSPPRGDILRELACLGRSDELSRVLDERVVDRVFVAVPGKRLHEFESAVRDCEEVGVPVHVATDLFEDVLSQGRMVVELVKEDDGRRRPILTFDPVNHPALALAAKRALDAVVSGVGLVALSPLFVFIALATKLTSRGPVLFVQERAGLGGRPFRMYKFRSMVLDAEAKRQALAHLNELDGPAFKIRNDPRVTFVGRVLRRFSLDELPQLWNVLKGDMSLVGPRPLPLSEARACERWQKRRQGMRPGLTCLWQIDGRSDITDFDEWARLDLRYIDRWSLGLDLKILLLTVPAVLLGSGAR